MKKILLPLLIVCFQTSIAQQPDRLFSPEELKADADYYFKMLYSNHPDPYYYYPLSEFEDKKNEIYAQLDRPMTKEQFAWIIGEVNSLVDIHSAVSFLGAQDIELEKMSLFPIVRIREDKLFLADNLNGDITEINGIAVSDILSDCRKYFNWKLPYEPNIRLLESWLNVFFFYKYKFTAPYQIKLRNSKSIQTIKGISLDEILQRDGLFSNIRGMKKKDLYNDSLKVYSYIIYPKSSAAILYIPTFSEKRGDEFQKTLQEFTEKVNDLCIKYIFYDLSNNNGGTDIGEEKALDIVKHDTIYLKLNRIDRVDGFNEKYNVNAIMLLPNFGCNIPPYRKLFVFQGLITLSAADNFCRIIADNKLGILVGDNTGEPTTAFTNTSSYRMPNTQIVFLCATKWVDYSDYFHSETLHPDIYWDINHNREFTEKELNEIIQYDKEHTQIQK